MLKKNPFLFIALFWSAAAAAQPIDIEMSAERWTVPEGTLFKREEGFPNGHMTLKEGFAVLKEGSFSNGVVEFDMKPLDFSDTGIQFRRKDADTAEFLYLRADPDCPAADDCIQYAPVTHGLMQWDIYPRFQGQAPVSPKGWNHLKLVVAGSHMRVFVNHEAFPSLEIDRLQGLADTGGIAFKGPAVFANLQLKPGEADMMPAAPAPAIDPRIVSHWLIAPMTTPASHDPSFSDLPVKVSWKPLDTEIDGLANVSRELGATPEPAFAWLKTSLQADRAMTKTVTLGFAREVSVFLNGSLVYSGKNQYYPSDKRLGPNGRLAPDNAKIALALKKGDNDIVIAVSNRWQTHQGAVKASPYGWGVVMAYADLANIKSASVASPAGSSEIGDVQHVMDEFHASVVGHDGARLSSLFIPEGSAWLNVLTDEAYKRVSDKPKIRVGSYKDFVKFVTESKASLDPQHSNIRIQSDGAIASVYFDFVFLIDGQVRNRGSEIWQLVKGEQGWRIAAITYSSDPSP